jgi:hypothetical protein
LWILPKSYQSQEVFCNQCEKACTNYPKPNSNHLDILDISMRSTANGMSNIRTADENAAK